MKLIPTKKDPRDSRFHFYRLFGSTAAAQYREIDNDAGLTNPDQNFENRPEGCTSYTVTDIATDQDGILYSHDFQFMKTLQVMGSTDASKGADGRTSFKVPVSIGLLTKELEPVEMSSQTQAYIATASNWQAFLLNKTVRKPAYIPISPVRGQDWFDAVYNALDKGFTVGFATQWSPDFNTVKYILPDNPTRLFFGHEYKITGVTLVDGQPYLKVKPWMGRTKYHNGICLMSRTLCNQLLGTLGTYCATLAKLPSDVIDAQKQQQIAVQDTLLALLQNLYISYLQLKQRLYGHN